MEKKGPERVVAFLCSACFVFGAIGQAKAYRRMTVDEKEDGIPLFWVEPIISIEIGRFELANASFEEIREVFRQSLRTWTRANGCTRLLLLDGGIAPSRDTNLTRGTPDGRNRVIFRAEDWPSEMRRGRILAIALTRYQRSTGMIIDADIDINAADYRWSTSPLPPHGHEDLQNMLTHELGHVIGLAHSEVEEATMYAHSTEGEVIKRDLHRDDIEAVCTIYPDNYQREMRSQCAIHPFISRKSTFQISLLTKVMLIFTLHRLRSNRRGARRSLQF
ncbi:MAG: matrixin family metalloprotease [Deltaproteobacteria bacterium]|nr:matrixin family metalloprotease [Deltaproteobacteria bacterium]